MEYPSSVLDEFASSTRQALLLSLLQFTLSLPHPPNQNTVLASSTAT